MDRLSPPGFLRPFRKKTTPMWTQGWFKSNPGDHAATISQFLREVVEVVNGVPSPPDFADYWKQAVQQVLRPKMSTQTKAMDPVLKKRQLSQLILPST